MSHIELTCSEHGCIHKHSGDLLDTCVIPSCTCTLSSTGHSYVMELMKRLTVEWCGLPDSDPHCPHCHIDWYVNDIP